MLKIFVPIALMMFASCRVDPTTVSGSDPLADEEASNGLTDWLVGTAALNIDQISGFDSKVDGIGASAKVPGGTFSGAAYMRAGEANAAEFGDVATGLAKSDLIKVAFTDGDDKLIASSGMNHAITLSLDIFGVTAGEFVNYSLFVVINPALALSLKLFSKTTSKSS